MTRTPAAAGMRQWLPGAAWRARAAGAAALVCASAQAQPAPPTPGAVQDSLPASSLPRLSTPAQVLFPADVTPVRRDVTRRFLVSGFKFTGNTVVSDALLSRALERYLDLELTLAELDKVADYITAIYRAQGFTVARAFIPAQRVDDGLVEIQIIEGRIESIAFDKTGRYSKEFLQPYLAPLVDAKANPLVTDAILERQLLLLNDLPGLKARATLSPGRQFGGTIVQLTTEEKIAGASLGYSNTGRDETGTHRVEAGFDINNPLALGDQFSLRAMRTTNSLLRFMRLGYSIPLSSNGLRLAVSSSRTEYDLGGAFVALGIAGSVRSSDATLLYPFVRTRARNVLGALQYRQTSSAQTVLGTPFSQANVKLLTGSVNSTWVGETSSTTNLNAALTTNALGLGSSTGGGTNHRFFKLDGDLTYLTSTAPKWDFYFRGRTSFATTALPDTERASIGGSDSVRGYPSASLRGDVSYQGQFEVRRQWMLGGTPGYVSTFADLGGVRYKGFSGWDRLASIGVGATAYVMQRGQVRAEYARPLLDVLGQKTKPQLWVSLNVAF